VCITRPIKYLGLLGLVLLIGGLGCEALDALDRGPRNRRPMIDEVDCFKTFSAAKKAMHAAGKPKSSDHQWHHIVGQNRFNVAKFGEYDLHCTDNLVYIPKDKHKAISAHYMSKTRRSKQKRVYEWLADMDFERQHAYGTQFLRRYNISLRKHGAEP